MNRKENFTAGFIRENPVFSLYLGLCSTLAITTTLNNAIGMGVAVIVVLIMSNVIISLIRNITPSEIRIPVYIVIIATLVKIIPMLIKAYAPSLDSALGVFIPLIVVNCIILGRAEAFASKNGVFDSALDGLGMGLGYTVSMSHAKSVRLSQRESCPLTIRSMLHRIFSQSVLFRKTLQSPCSLSRLVHSVRLHVWLRDWLPISLTSRIRRRSWKRRRNKR